MVGAFKGWSTVSIKDILCSSKKHPYLPPLLPHRGHFCFRPSPRWNFHFTGCLSYPPPTPWNFCNFSTLLGTPWKNISVKNAFALYFNAKACHCFHNKERKKISICMLMQCQIISNNIFFLPYRVMPSLRPIINELQFLRAVGRFFVTGVWGALSQLLKA